MRRIFILQKTVNPISSFSALRIVVYFVMYPLRSRFFILSCTGESERFTFEASSFIVSLELFCNSRKIAMSVLSRFVVFSIMLYIFLLQSCILSRSDCVNFLFRRTKVVLFS